MQDIDRTTQKIFKIGNQNFVKWSSFSADELTDLYFNYYMKDMILFIMECVKLPTPGGSEPFEPYNRQVEVINKFLSDNYLIILKSRQIGISTIVQAIIVYLLLFYDNYTIGILSRQKDEAVDFVTKVRNMIDSLPDWLKLDYVKKREKSFRLENNSAIYAETVNPAKPGGVFRGKSLSLLVIDEAAHISYIDEAFTGLAPTLSSTHKACASKQIPYGAIVMSTPNGTIGDGAWFYNLWQDALSGSTKFKPIKIHWSSIPRFRNDPLWYADQCKILREQWQIDQELELKFIAPRGAVFTGEIAEQLRNRIIKPVQEITIIGSKVPESIDDKILYPRHKEYLLSTLDKDEREGPVGSLWYWYDDATLQRIANDKDKFIVVSVDSATMFGSDKSAIEIFELSQMDQIGEFGGKCRVDTLIDVLENKIMPLFKRALLVIEINNPGNQLIEYFTKHSRYGLNLYKRTVLDEKKGYNVRYRKPGLATTNVTRPLIIDAMYTIASEYNQNIKSERLINQLISLRRKTQTGRIEGSPHDDYVMAFAFACYIRQYDKLHAFDGILLPDNQVEQFVNIVEENEQFDYVDNTSYQLLQGSEINQSNVTITNSRLNRSSFSDKSNLLNPTALTLLPKHLSNSQIMRQLLGVESNITSNIRHNRHNSDPMDDLDISSLFEVYEE